MDRSKEVRKAILTEAFETEKGTRLAYASARRTMAPKLEIPDDLGATPLERVQWFLWRLEEAFKAQALTSSPPAPRS